MGDLTRTTYTDEEIQVIEEAAERRGREAVRVSQRTIEPAGGEMPPTIPDQLSQVSHAGLALSVGDLLQRVGELEQIVTRLVPPERPAFVEHEPEPQGPDIEGESPGLYPAVCPGHPAGPDDPMGETVYCDGSCQE
jgi:hypothetical protein